VWRSLSKHFPLLVDNTGNTPATVCNSRPQSAILLSHTAIFRYMAATLPVTHRLHNCSNTLPVNIARLNVPLGYMAATLPATHRLHNCSNTLPLNIARLNVPLGYMAATLLATHRLHNFSNTLPVNIARLNVP